MKIKSSLRMMFILVAAILLFVGAASSQVQLALAAPPAKDTTPPSVPTGLAASNVQVTQVTLNWTASTADVGVTNYIIRRNGVVVATIGAVTTYTDTGLT